MNPSHRPRSGNLFSPHVAHVFCCVRFVDYFGYSKKDIGYLGKGDNKLNGKIDVATMQSLKNNLDIINNYSFVIVDECHHIPAITFEQIVKQFFGKYILGLSATPNRKDG